VEVQVTFSQPFVVPENLGFLPFGELLVHPEECFTDPGLVITCDTGSEDRLGTMAGRLGGQTPVLVLDHHRSNPGYGTVNLVDPSAAATAVVVAELLDGLGIEIDAEIAACLYTGLSTDTGSFRHGSAAAETHLLAARLLDTGIRHDEIARQLYDTRPFAALSLLAELFARAVLEPEAAGGLGLVWTAATDADTTSRGLSSEQLEPVVDLIRATREAGVAAVFKQSSADAWTVSVRSRGVADVGAVCVSLGGGGHRLAAGFSATGPLEQVVGLLRTALAVQAQ
jgi:phosphoesterase RecJ-like protein